MTYEGLRDWLGSACKSLVSIKEDTWKFAGLDVPGLEGLEVKLSEISRNLKNSQKVSDLILALDNLQFSDCQKRNKWHERLKREKDPTIRLEITRHIIDSEDKSYSNVLEIVRLLKGTKAIVEDTNEIDNVDSSFEELLYEL